MFNMNKTEYLLTCLTEECAEVQQSVSKALRFGLNDTCNNTKEPPSDRIVEEYVHVIAVMELLEETGILKKHPNISAEIKKKKEKVLHFMKYSRERKTLDL